MLAGGGRRRLLVGGGVAALVAWSLLEATVLWNVAIDAGYSEPAPPLLLAVLFPLPLLLALRAPFTVAVVVICLVLLRGVLDLRAPGATLDTLMLAVALFAAEAGARRGPPVRGAALAVLLIGGTVALDLAGAGQFAFYSSKRYIALAAVVAGSVGAGYALRDRRREARRLQREVAELDAQGPARIDTLLATERRRIAAEVEDAVALLLHGVRPLAERAARATAAERLAADMRTVQASARAAMTEMRRALHLLRGPVPDPEGVDLASAVAASRRRRVRHAVGWSAPVALLAALGIADQLTVPPLPMFFPFPRGSFTVPAPELGGASPYVTAVLCVLPLLARARAPVSAALAVFALLVARMLIDDLTTLNFNQYYVTAAATFLGAAHARSALAGVAIGVIGAGTAVGLLALEQPAYIAVEYGFAVLLPSGAAAAGLLVHDRVATAARARRAQQDVDRRHEAMARERVVSERLQAARELHDVVGHAVTIIGLQAAAAVTLSRADVERARDAAATVVQVAGDAERDLARLSAVLGTVAADAAPPPLSLAELVERVRAAGVPVTLEQEVPDDAVPLALSLTAFRIVQEALTNVRRHAGSPPTRVTLERDGGMLIVEVVNAGGPAAAPRPGGRGLLGMRERAELYGGTLTAGPGPGPDGGWRVRAELPLEADPAATAIAAGQRPLET